MTVEIRIGDVRSELSKMADESVQCVVTSPPYWGLRDYGIVGQLGTEKTYQEHIAVMVEVFREVRRVLRADGTLWLNYGDCYATSPNGRSAAATKAAGNDDRTFRDKPFSTIGGALKPKDLCMMPNRIAIALQEDGWYVRSEIVWHKPNPMPESIKDRPGTSHEKIWLMSKSPRYFYDAAAVKVPMASSSISRLSQDVASQAGSARANGGGKTNGPMRAVGIIRGRDTYGRHTLGDALPKAEQRRIKTDDHENRRYRGFNQRWDDRERKRGLTPRHEGHINHTTLDDYPRGERNLRNVWTISPKGFKGAHFATFPPDLIVPCIKAGCPAGGIVLDPFGGAGTTGLVAKRFGRNAILIELNGEYAELARVRIDLEPDPKPLTMPAVSGTVADTDLQEPQA